MCNIDKEKIYNFLLSVDKDFPVPLSDKVNLSGYVDKLLRNNATIVCREYDGKIVGSVIGYTDNLSDNMAYISIVGVLNEYRGKGIANQLILEFLNICESKKIDAVHLYTHNTNNSAIRLYDKLGFNRMNNDNEDESRKDDVHLILKIGG